ncbi:hybrid sensor histidine kinase/response regulator [Hahella sp. CR1]|uniref:hybrid sensor histidine kinase/response regulator n=1 Tax=Hahella sp. CR1 TaxID=2992807 RepID=UPI002441C0BC|nr:hybrid sensor histidine kinase/response regulator [Hahella sp. CR1]MDG9667018.1 hybrid sensor histidine kinase/response regulator [Hahella sp. CR1]
MPRKWELFSPDVTAGAEGSEENYNALIVKEQARTILRQSPVNALSNGVVVIIALWAFKDLVSDLTFWICLAFVIVSVSIQLKYIYYQQALNEEEFSTDSFLNVCVVIAFISGLVWTAFVLIFYDESGHQALMSALVCGLLAGCINSIAVYLRLYFFFSVPFVLTYIGILFLSPDADQHSLEWLMCIYYLMCIKLASILHSEVNSSFRLRYENIDMLKNLEKQKDIAEKANAAKSKFLASASHDLRQPLHALGYFVEALKLSPDKNLKILNNIDTSVHSLEALFKSLLDISRLDAGVVHCEKQHFYLGALLKEIHYEYTVAASAKQLQLTLPRSDLVVYSDAKHVKRIFANLMSNAIRNTSTGEVKLLLETNDDKQITIRVMDTGAGIPADKIESIFDEFYQLNNPERDRTKGLGLGLSIVKRLTRLIGSEINVDSQINQGSTFTFSLPLGDPNLVKQESCVDYFPNQNLSGKQVLLIDDEADIRHAMTKALSAWGCDVSSCQSKSEALELCKGFIPDLIIADLRLRENLTGIDAINSIRALLNDDIPGLLISGDTAPERLSEAAQSGYKLLHKPLKPAELRLNLLHIFRATPASSKQAV